MSSKKRSQVQNLKKYRSLYAEAKRRGLVRGDKDARSLVPSSYMKTRLNKLSQYMTDEFTTVKVSPKIAKAYRAVPNDVTPLTVGRRVVVRKEPNFIARVRRGVPTLVRCLKNGEHEKVPLPLGIRTLNDFVRSVETNPIYEHLICQGEQWVFMFDGNPSYTRFHVGDKDEVKAALLAMAERLEAYQISATHPEEFGNKFELYRTHVTNWEFNRPEMRQKRQAKKYKAWRERQTPERLAEHDARKAELRRKSRQYNPSYQRELEASRKYKQRRREQMTLPEIEKELEKQRERMRKRRAEGRAADDLRGRPKK